MLKQVGASGQISLGKKYAGQLFDLTVQADGCIVMQPVKVVPVAPIVQKQPAVYKVSPASPTDGGWRTPVRLTRRAAAAARSPAEVEAARTQWEEENKEAIEAMNQRMTKIGSVGMRMHEWRKKKVAAEQPR